ncbi:MAG: hypothetical protein HGA49_10175 [Eubacteriaceae bacterium]|nr:hypothetical protein [Eubacteriaceae bacterium]
MNQLLVEKDEILANFEFIKSTLYDTLALETHQAELQNEMEIVAEMIQQIIYENAHVALDQAEYQRKYESLTQRFDAAKASLESVTGQIKENTTRRKNIESFLSELKRHEGILTEFDTMLWHSMVDHAIINPPEDIHFIFKDGTEVKI